MPTINENLNNFIKSPQETFKALEDSVKRNEWSFKFDDISDILYFSPIGFRVSNDSVLISAGEQNCIALRIGKQGNIESILVENFGSMFVPQNAEFQKLYDKLTQKQVNLEPAVVRRAFALILSDLSSLGFSASAVLSIPALA